MALKNNSGAKLWQQAKEIIPGGNQLLSKRAEMFLPEQWPAYYKKSKGCEVWDLDDNHYYDFSIMGIGTSSLGYANDEVNEAVISAIQNGSMSSLNCYEEVELAQQLIAIHPWSDAVRFTRTGGESCALAIRIARAFSKKEIVAFCGYHGWHDWYLATNLSDSENLDEQLLPGLKPAGVPKQLHNTAIPFKEGDIDGFKQIVEKYGDRLGVVMMEVFRHSLPDVAFLKEVKAIAKANDIVVIFDEISSGFRLNAGASHLLIEVEPDICVLGKALGNGHPIGAIIGRKEVMDAAQQSFISSSYWTERVGPAAAIATIKKMQDQNVPNHLDKIGKRIGDEIFKLANKYDLNMDILPPNPLVTFTLNYENALEIKTLFTQEMLKRGYLASQSVYVSYCHTEEIIDEYIINVDEVFKIIKKAIDNNVVIESLEGPVAHNGFQRLT